MKCVSILLLLLACTPPPHKKVDPPPPAITPTAQPLHMFSPLVLEDTRAEALAVLERDAWRRHWQVMEMVQPGTLKRASQLSVEELPAFTPSELFEIGAQLFHGDVTRADGWGRGPAPQFRRIHEGTLGGPDATRCSACHWRGGPAGAGDAADNAYLDGDGDTQASALTRNPIPLHGAGWLEILAQEMSQELQTQRDVLVSRRQSGPLTVQGVSFGVLGVDASGNVDTSGLLGVDADLVVKPFGWKGRFPSLRSVVEDELNVHLGLQSALLEQGADADGDGVQNEFSDGQVAALTLFAAMQEVPVVQVPVDSNLVLREAEGRHLFERMGCAVCHVPSLVVKDPRYHVAPGVDVELSVHGAQPRLTASPVDGKFHVPLFSDLKRHDVGSALADTREDHGVPAGMFLTRPLWGLSRSRPYLHDARASTIQDAILLHGGEAQASRDAFAALPEEQRAAVRVFLTSLTRQRRLVAP